MLIGEVEVDVTIDSKDTGRVTSTLTHTGDVAVLLNRTGMDERFSVGNTKDGGMECYFDDDQPQDRDVHLEPALSSQEMVGLYQPDGRGEYVTNGITMDDRDNMLFVLAGADSAGDYDMYVADYRPGYASTSTTCIFRRWSAIIKNPCGPDRYVGQATDFYPGSGICSIALAGGATNLTVDAGFTPGDELVDYVVKLLDPTLVGSGNLEITDCIGNTTVVPVTLDPEATDQTLPVVSGSVNPVTHEFEGTCTDAGGIYAVELMPYGDNLQIVSVTPDPPSGATSVDFVIGLVDPMANGRGYVRVVDGCGLRAYALVDIDAVGPVCEGFISRSKRYVSTDTPIALPDDNDAGVTSSITVTDIDIIEDVDVTFNISHPYAADIDMYFTSPVAVELFTDRGSTGNDFVYTTLDDEAAEVIPSSYPLAPFTGRWQPEVGPLSLLDGVPAANTYTLRVADDYVNYSGTFDNWLLTITSVTFPERFEGLVTDQARHDFGLCTIEMLPGAVNLALMVDPWFTPGDGIISFSVEMVNPTGAGAGTVRVSDCAGNYCEMPVALGTYVDGDIDHDGDVDLNDFATFALCFHGAAVTVPPPGCSGEEFAACDFDGDADVDLGDFSTFANNFTG
jgi:subtilisin-like proprotein convertase family protein